MKGKQSKKEKKKEKSSGGKGKELTDYQKEKLSKQDLNPDGKPKL